jgi:hypothetical protein
MYSRTSCGGIPYTQLQTPMPRKNHSKNLIAKLTVKRSKKTTPKKKKSRRGSKSKGKSRSSLTPAGLAFLKVATCPCDFALGSTGFTGIPDEYDGPSVTESQTSVSTYAPVSTADNYIVLAPTPGVAYWYGNRAAGTTGAITLTGVVYDDASTLYASSKDSQVVTSFRYASNAIELVNLTNSMTWSGSIEGWKTDAVLGSASDIFADTGSHNMPLQYHFIDGLALESLRPEAVMPIKDGIYAAAFNSQSVYPFTPIQDSTSYVELTTNQSYANAPDNNLTWTCTAIDFVGFGTLETIVIKVPAAAASQQLMVRTWCTLEYQVPRTSILFNFSKFSPPFDPEALAILHAHHRSHGGFVTAKENATFWKNVLLWMRRASTIASHFPGPIGTVGGLTREILNVVDSSKGHELW